MDIAADFERAVALHRDGKIAEAEALCHAILSRDTDHARTLHLLGAIRYTAGAAEEGILLLRRAVTAKPDYGEAEFNLGAMLAAIGKREQAIEHFGRSATLRPDHAESHRRHGSALMEAGRFAAATDAFHRTLALNPGDVVATVDMCTAMLALGRAEEAAQFGQRAIALAPRLPDAYARFGRVLHQLRRYDEATAQFRRALEIDPGSTLAANSLTLLLHEQDRLDEAEAECRAILARAPKNPVSLNNLSMVLMSYGRVADAIPPLREAIAADPGQAGWLRTLLSAIMYLPGLQENERHAEHVAFGRVMAARVTQPLPPPENDRDPARRLRVGWLSSDFRSHPVGRNVRPLIEHGDRTQFEHYLYADVRRPDETTNWFRAQVAGWRSITGLTDDAVAATIRDDRIDIMIYLAGRFDFNRPQVAAWRPAPVQVSLFDVATSGMAEMDYFVVDSFMAPARRSEKFVEHLLRMPNVYLHDPIEFAAPVTPPPALDKGHVTFGSFNNPAKINDEVLRLWAEVLRAVPGSRLKLKYRGYYRQAGLQRRVKAAFETAGIDPGRIEMGGNYESSGDHIALYRDVDIALDTHPFTGSTTTFEALWMGVPVVTLAGDSVVARWSASMVGKVGLSDLVASSPKDYVGIAARLAADPERLRTLRQALRAQVAASPLCNGRRTTRHLERGLRAAWRRWCRADVPAMAAKETYALGSDVEYLVKLRELIDGGAVGIDIDTKRHDSLDSPIYVAAHKERMALAFIAAAGGTWWLWGKWAAAGAALALVLAYASLGRRYLRRQLEKRTHDVALKNPDIWRKLWRFGGIRLVSRAESGAETVCAAPEESWIRFIDDKLKG